jgi:hypothetical protein
MPLIFFGGGGGGRGGDGGGGGGARLVAWGNCVLYLIRLLESRRFTAEEKLLNSDFFRGGDVDTISGGK